MDREALGGARPLGGEQPCATSAALAEAEPRLPAGAAAPPSGTVRGEPSLPSPSEAGRARRAAAPPGAPSSLRGRRRGPRAHPARPQARVPPPFYIRSDTPDAGSHGGRETLTRALAPPLRTDAASRWPRSALRGGGSRRGPDPGTGRG